jgi:transcription elongation GreA/GreB family factor
MSRAFTKEIDDKPPQPLEDRPLSAAPNFVTPSGATMIEAKLQGLLQQAVGATPDQQPALQRDIRYWTSRSSTMQIISTPSAPLEVQFGTTVDLLRGGKPVQLIIVGEDEADPAQGRIAWTSPLARALEGAERGELIEFESPAGVEMVEVLAIWASDSDVN